MRASADERELDEEEEEAGEADTSESRDEDEPAVDDEDNKTGDGLKGEDDDGGDGDERKDAGRLCSQEQSTGAFRVILDRKANKLVWAEELINEDDKDEALLEFSLEEEGRARGVPHTSQRLRHDQLSSVHTWQVH